MMQTVRGERASWSIAQGMVSRAIDETHSREDNCMRSSMTTFCFLSVHVLSCVCGMTVQAQSLKVLVLDASDGKPQANVKVEYFCMGPPINSAPKTAVTDK